jgi:GTP cyclohydrolase I|tara:strand:+ start:500 stop:760 length:261 start_codon:yes stop_codon:yes gene_type:complete
MPVRTFNSNEIAKLKQLMNEGIQVTGEVETLREGLKDTVKAIAEEMDMKPAVLNKAIRIAYKNEFAQVQDSFSAVEEVLQAVGRDT